MANLYYKVGPSFWLDHDWNDDERLAALYLLTCPHRTTEGLFRMPLTYAATDMGWELSRFKAAFSRLLTDGFVEYDDQASVVLIVSALKWQAPENPNQVKAALRAIDKLPETPLLSRFRTLAETLCPRLAEGLREPFAEPFAEPFREPFGEPLAEGFAEPPTPTPYSNSSSNVTLGSRIDSNAPKSSFSGEGDDEVVF